MFYLLSFMDRTALSILVDAVKADLNASDTEMSLMLGPAFTLVYAIFGIPFGWAADRLPRRWVIYVGITLWSLSAAAAGLARTSTHLFLARAGIGVGEAALSPSAFSLIADRFSRARLALATCIYQAAPWLGGATAFAVTPAISHNAGSIEKFLPALSVFHPWQLALMMTGVPGVALAFLVFTFFEPARKAPAATKAQPVGGFFEFFRINNVLMTRMLTAFGLLAMMAYADQAWVPSYLQRTFGLKPFQFGPMLSLAGALTAVSLFVKGMFMDWLFSRGVRDAYMRLYLALLALSVPAAIVIFVTRSFFVFTVCYILIQVITVSFMGFLAPTLQLLTPSHLRGRVIAAFLLVFSICGALGPVVIGIVTDRILGDPNQIGLALRGMSITTVLVSLIILCFALTPLRVAILAEEASASGSRAAH
jgi:MFS family permease